jgi:hypothetical protein
MQPKSPVKRALRNKLREEKQDTGKSPGRHKATEEIVNYGNTSFAVNESSESLQRAGGEECGKEKPQEDEAGMNFPNGKQTMQFEEFIDLIKNSCEEKE